MSKTAVVLCPGRGSYTASELGYLSGAAPACVLAELNPAIDRLDNLRIDMGDPTIRDMDGAHTFSPELFRGENASCLTFACTVFDFLRLDRKKLDIVAIGGNSMGWYSALFAAGAFSLDDTHTLVEVMGGMTREGQIGGHRPLPPIEAVPVKADPVGGERPAPVVEPAADPVEPDHVGAQLGQGHATRRGGHEGRALDDREACQRAGHWS